MDITLASDADQKVWDEIVKSSPQGTLFHTWKWLKIMEKHNFTKMASGIHKAQLYPIMVKMENDLIGLMPIFIYNTPFVKMACSPAFGVENAYLGPILNNFLTLRSHRKQVLFYQFHNEVDNYLKTKMNVNYVTIHSSPGLSDPRPYIWSDYQVLPQYTYFIDLKQGKKIIWDNFSRTLKQDINKVKKKGIYVEIGSKKYVENIFGLLKKRNRVFSNIDYILEIFDNFESTNLKVFVAKHENEFLSGVVTISYKNKVSLWIGTPRNSYNGTTPNTLIYWEAINWAIENGYEYFEIIGASDIKYFMFKSKFNAELIPYYILKWYSPWLKFGKTIQQLFKQKTTEKYYFD
jgi:hypothetical protein